MAESAWACKVTRANQSAIASEDPGFDLAAFNKWLAIHDVGYFIRDPDSPFDCRYMSDVVFDQMYIFANGDEGALFRRIVKK